MAPTLFGRHKDVECVQCGHEYEVGASVEMNDEGNVLMGRITQAVCPNCRFRANVKNLPVFKGDRILVNKFPYELGRPERWDVCVFKFPEDPERNYIKRMVGLPGETLRISRGDVYARQQDAADFEILRKDDPDKQLAIQIIVADDAHPPTKLLEQGWPERWAGMKRASEPGAIDGWTDAPDLVAANAEQRTYGIKAADWSWLRYRNYVPSQLDWDSVREGLPPTPNPVPQLVTDMYAYNSFDPASSDRNLFWVGDLTVSGRVTVSDVSGTDPALKLELVEGVRKYQCEIDLQTGQATLTHTDELNLEGPPISLGTAGTSVKGTGTYRFDFANVDDRLCLWINGRLIPFGKAAEYRPVALPDPQDGDLMPAGVAARGASVEFSNLMVKRDIYY
ncbi:MAG: signal peptidase I, partial [Planctomycetales bacterium 12-60-4]